MLELVINGYTLTIAMVDVVTVVGLLLFAASLLIAAAMVNRKGKRKAAKEKTAVTLHIARNGKRFYP